MRYISTRGKCEPMSFRQAVMTGLAPDGGLFLPENIPQVQDRLESWCRLSYRELAVEIMRLYSDIPESDLRQLVTQSYAAFRHPDVAPVVRAGGLNLLELFHGPTLSFKDIALQFLGNLFEYILDREGGSLNILAATSGDTGSAAIHAVKGRKRIRIFVLYPEGRISAIQERQMTTVLDDNVFNIAVKGTFDDCQGIVKELFGDAGFKSRYCLGAVNSINWARILAQIVYYFFAAFRVMAGTGAAQVAFTVPTGNFGNILAAYLACRMGLPVSRLVLATNENDILARFFATGVYSAGRVTDTISPAMDIQAASNFERYLYYRTGGSADDVRTMMAAFRTTGRLDVAPFPDGSVDELIVAGSASTARTLQTIREIHAGAGYLLDPHTAVGVSVGRLHRRAGEPMIFVATAHPAKFGRAIMDATGSDLAHHELIDGLTSLPVRSEMLKAEASKVKEYVSGVLDGS